MAVVDGVDMNLTLQLESGDGLPQEVCIVCRAQLDLSVTFKRQVQQADTMLRHHVAEKSENNDEPEASITGDPLSEEGVGESVVEEDIVKDSELEEEVKDADTLKWEDITVKQEEVDIVVAEPWPESALEENVQNDTEEILPKKEAEEMVDVSANEIKEEKDSPPSDNDTDVEESDYEEEKPLSEIKLNLTCTDRIECSCQFCSENKTELEKVDPNGNRLECFFCLETFRNAKLFNRHKVIHDELFKCEYCVKKFYSIKGLQAHQRLHTEQPLEDTKISTPEDPPSQTQTSEQSESVRRSSRPSKAPERHVVPHYSCSKCERMYSDRLALENHEKSHLGKPGLKCNHCGKKFFNKEYLEKHIQSSHIKRLKNVKHPNQCNVCGHICESRSHLFSHMRSHKSTVHLCEVCGKTVSLNAYPAHKRSHFNTDSEEVFHCDICQKKFNNKVSLRTHKISYHGPLKYTCEVCGKQFTTMALMKHHQHVHSGKRDHVCQVCGRAFTLKITLKSHMRIHTGEMPYKCNDCGRQFTWKTTYRNHVSSCKSHKNNSGINHQVMIPHYNNQYISFNLPQELPIDYSEEAKHEVPIDYSEQARHRQTVDTETKGFPIVLHLNEDLKYASQQQLFYAGNVKPYSRDM